MLTWLPGVLGNPLGLPALRDWGVAAGYTGISWLLPGALVGLAVTRRTRSSAAGWAAGLAAGFVLLLGSAQFVGTATAATFGTPHVRARVLRLVDRTRTIRLPGGKLEPRPLVTIVRIPQGRGPGPFPLVVFGHGFAVTPAPYASLLDAWAAAGFVVAAPVFPLENANAPGGPNESDLVNQPADLRFVIARLTAASASGRGPLAGLIRPGDVAVAGHSDGGETALLTAFDRGRPDPSIRAAVILSGAQTPSPFAGFPAHSPALLAVQGTADTVNPETVTRAFFRIAPRPKYLLLVDGAEHLPPYSVPGPDLRVVERTTTAFLDRFLEHGSAAAIAQAAAAPGVASLVADP